MGLSLSLKLYVYLCLPKVIACVFEELNCRKGFSQEHIVIILVSIVKHIQSMRTVNFRF